VLNSTSLPLAVEATAEFCSAPVVTLHGGDLVCFLTDGVFEAMSPDRSLFGIQRTLDMLLAHRHDSPELIIEALFGAVSDFIGDSSQQDDFTALVIKVAPDS
jgi:serine phosphatase RsbU (regulator of sigma subunit)